MKKIKCQCPETSFTPKEHEDMYSEEEKSGMNHEPGECTGTNDIKLYERNGKKLYLCSCCFLFGDKELKNWINLMTNFEFEIYKFILIIGLVIMLVALLARLQIIKIWN